MNIEITQTSGITLTIDPFTPVDTGITIDTTVYTIDDTTLTIDSQ